MIILKEVALLASILCLTTVTAVTNVSKQHQFPEKQLFYDYASFDNTSMVYAVCDKSGLDDVTKACKVTYEKHSFEKESQMNTCDIDLKVKRDNHRMNGLIRVIQYGEDKAIVLWWEIPKSLIRDRKIRGDAYARTFVVHFPSCKYVENEVVMSKNENLLDYGLPMVTYVTTHGNHFDIIYQSKADCADKFCLATFDAENKKVSGPISFVPFTPEPATPFFTPIELTSPSDVEYVHVDTARYPPQVVLSLYKNNALTPLKVFPAKQYAVVGRGYSTANNLIGICVLSGEEGMTCAQYDVDGKLKLEMKADEIKAASMTVAVHNVRDGGFFIFIDRGNHSQVYKYDAAGKKIGVVELDVKKCDDDRRIPWAKFYENKENEYCIAYTCFYAYDSYENNKGLLDWSSKCFKAEELV